MSGEISVPFTFTASVDPYGPCIRGPASVLRYQHAPIPGSTRISGKAPYGVMPSVRSMVWTAIDAIPVAPL